MSAAVGLAASLLGVAACRPPLEVVTPGGSALTGQDLLPLRELPDQLSFSPPKEVDFTERDEQDIEEMDRPFFDRFAWQDFIALNWPALEDQRGEPDPKKHFGDKKDGDTFGPTVWGTWKSLGELYPVDPLKDPPTPWNSFDADLGARRTNDLDPFRPGKTESVVPFKDLPSKGAGKVKILEDILQAGTPSPRYPLVAQNKTFVRYETRVNRIEYNCMLEILSAKQRQPKVIVGPDPRLEPKQELLQHSMTVRAAWRELPNDAEVRSRFYHVPAKVVDWKEDGTPLLQDREMGLVGLHIVHKTPMRKNWIWMTFEHVDNTKRSPGGISPPSFNPKDEGMKDGTPVTPPCPPCTVETGKPIPTKDCNPVNVARKTPIRETTMQVNKAYWDHCQIRNTVWRNYQLVATQWPRKSGEDWPNVFPEHEVANTTMETYKQEFSCMECHSTATRVKLVLYPQLRAIDE
jgi:hypothetical protein